MLHTYRDAHITFLRAPALEAIPGVVHAFSTRRMHSGDLSPAAGGAGLHAGHARFMSAVGMPAWPLARLRQVHSNFVHAVQDHGFANEAPEGDASQTRLRGLALGVFTADCVPVLIADSAARAVAVAHAGWRGTSEGVVRKTVEALASGRVRAEDLSVAIGPHIGVCCMEVGEEVVEWFQDPDVFERRPEWGRPHLNLAEANRRQLADAGVLSERIQISSLCTRCRPDLFHSYRRDREAAGRMLSVIGIEP